MDCVFSTDRVDEDYIEEGTAIDNTITKSAFAGIRCIYTASRNMAFAFDDVFIFSDNSVPDIPDEPDNPDTRMNQIFQILMTSYHLNYYLSLH